jgi:hypothetical protein
MTLKLVCPLWASHTHSFRDLFISEPTLPPDLQTHLHPTFLCRCTSALGSRQLLTFSRGFQPAGSSAHQYFGKESTLDPLSCSPHSMTRMVTDCPCDGLSFPGPSFGLFMCWITRVQGRILRDTWGFF